MKYYIYKIENIKNNKKYIGLTNNIERRKNRHFSDLRCGRHDNKFLQSEFTIDGEENFTFEKIFEENCSDFQIGEYEKKFIKEFDSYYNGYNQNKGGNYGASNGGSRFIKNDVLYILACLEFLPRCGQTLAEIFDTTRTTINRIKLGVNHISFLNEYQDKTFEERKTLYEDFNKISNVEKRSLTSNNLDARRKLSREQVYMVLLNDELKLYTKAKMTKLINVKSTHTINCLLNGKSYKDYIYDYQLLDNYDKEKIAMLLSNK